jgi:hypothetical protein
LGQFGPKGLNWADCGWKTKGKITGLLKEFWAGIDFGPQIEIEIVFEF